MDINDIIFLALCGICGSLNGAVLIASCFKLKDLKQFGSGNPGTTNAVRAYGLWAGLAVFLIDTSKAFIPISIGAMLISPSILGLGIGMSVIGHCFSPWLNFQGGKGVATLVGGILAFDLPLGLWSIGVWITTYALTKLSALSALLMIAFVFGAQIHDPSIGIVLSLLIVFLRHYSNWKAWIVLSNASHINIEKKNTLH